MSVLSKIVNIAAAAGVVVGLSATAVQAGQTAHISQGSKHTRVIPGMCDDPNGGVYFNGGRASGNKRSSNCCDFEGASNVLRDVQVQDKKGRWYITDVREKQCHDFGGGDDNNSSGNNGHAGGVSDGAADGPSTGL